VAKAVPQTARSGIGGNKGAVDAARLLELYETMVVIRRAEESLTTLFADGEIPGFIHLSIGQEAVSVGVMSALTDVDTIASTHRGHGHALAKGMDLDRFFLELMGKDEGLCRGRGGSMHVAQSAIGMLGANGIVGAGIPIAMGSAMAHQVNGTGAIAVAFFGDGATAEGVLHESLNMAALWKLPLLFACETNGWSEFSPASRQIAMSLEALAGAYGIGYTRIDGNDVAAVAASVAPIVDGLRAGSGPQLIDCHTARVRGHFEGDAQKYRDAAEFAAFEAKDPLARTRAELLGLGASSSEIEAVDAGVADRIQATIARARRAALPDFEAALRDVYTPGAAA
jgi:pyruvate dehydrogenase E1 component alpha subunit